MVKLKTVPSLGNRMIHLPHAGDVKMENGEFEVEDSVAEKLAGKAFGKFQILDASGKIKAKQSDQEGSEEGGSSEEEGMSLDQLKSLRVVDLQELLDQMKEAGAVTEEEIKAYNEMKKPGRAEFIFNKMNAAE